MSVRIAINGFGRIGRGLLRAAYERDAAIECVAINDIADDAALAHLFAHDSVYGPFPGTVTGEPGRLIVDGQEISLLHEAEPAALPWDELGIDVVVDASGRFRTREAAAAHLSAGARKVVVSAPVTGADATIVLGVNTDAYDPDTHHVISNASCTTNCLAPVARVLHDLVGIRHGLMTTVHAYTGDQRLLDMPHKDLRRARAAALNLIPTTTGAAKAIGLVIPELAGKLNGFAVRVPTPTGSLVDLTIEGGRETSTEEVNAAIRAAAEGPMAGVLRYSEAPLVSSDIIRAPESSIFDAPLTAVMDGTMVKVVSWYDNEWGYANRLLELAERVVVPVATR